MRASVREILQPVLGDDGAWERLSREIVSEVVAPGASLRSVGEAVHDVLVIESGVFEVSTPGSPPRWATAGSMIGLAASLSGAPSPLSVTAVRHGRLSRIPARALGHMGGDVRSSMAAVARMAQLPDHELATLPPDPLVITALLEGVDDELEATIVQQLEEAVRSLEGGRLVRITATPPASGLELAEELATYEDGARTVVYVVRGGDGDRAASLVGHADRVVLLQPFGLSSPASAARTVACDGASRRHTELVHVLGARESEGRSTRRMQAPRNVKRIHILPELSATRLELLLTDMRQSAREHESLREFEVFAELSGPELAWVQSTLQWERVDGGSLLVRQGDAADDAWLLRAGRLQVVRETPAGERHVAWLGPGAVVGETALLTEGRRTESVRAVRDSTVARLDRQTIAMLLERSIGFARAVTRIVVARSMGEFGVGMRRARTLAVVPLTEPDRVARFVAELADVLGAEGLDATVVDAARLNSTLGRDASSTRRGDVGDGEIIAWLDSLERRHDAVVLVCSAEVDSWTRRAVRQSDHVLLVADAKSAPARRPIEEALLGDGGGTASIVGDAGSREGIGFVGVRHLVLLQPTGITEATGTGAWLAERPLHTHHHMREGGRGDLARLARRVTGRAVALALSGASSRAPAHFGAVRAMADHGLPIDIVSGSSSGAGVAALVVTGMPTVEGLARAIDVVSKGVPRFRELQPPITALTSGLEADRVLQGVYGDRQLEDQLIPAILTAVDIRRHRLVQLTKGPLWKLVRASGSLPLLWPPVWHEGDLLVDGGIISYLPVEVFGDQADAGLVIASNLDETAGQGAPAFEGSLQYGTHISGWGELARRLRRSSAARPPGLVEILFHTMAIPSFQQLEGLAALAARDNVCVLTPPLGSFGLFEVTEKIGRGLESAAWAYAREKLGEVAAAWRGRRGGGHTLQ